MSQADRADCAAYSTECPSLDRGAGADQVASRNSNSGDTPQQAPDQEHDPDHDPDPDHDHDDRDDDDEDNDVEVDDDEDDEVEADEVEVDDDEDKDDDEEEDEGQRPAIDAMTTISSSSSRLSQSNPWLRSPQSQAGMSASAYTSTSASASTSTWSGFFAHSNNQAALSIIAVCCSSLSMTVANKYIVSGRHFSMNFLMLAVQSGVSAAAVHGAKSSGVITYPSFQWDSAWNWAPVSLGLVALMYSGSKALQYLSIPVYVIFKNLTIILIAYGEKIWFGGVVTQLELLSFVFMILSSVIAAGPNIVAAYYPSAESTDTGIGYLWIAVNCLVSAAYILGMRKKIKAMAFTDWQTSFYNNAISTSVLLLASIMFEGWSPSNFALNFPSDARSHLIIAMLLSGFVAVFISFCSAWCIRVTSSTTYSMIGALNKLPVAISGMVFFHDPVTLRSVSAVTIGFAAGLLYTYAKQVANEAKKRTLAGYAPIKMTSSGASHEDSASPGRHVQQRGVGRQNRGSSLSLIELPARRDSALSQSPTSRTQS